MFNITFYQFDKKENSTARPSAGGAVFQCVLKEPTNIVNPDIVLQFAFTTVPKFNYCHIPEFERYYFVRNWTALNGGRWVASLKCDVLATYKNVIGGKSFLIERSSEEFDGYLTDNHYPAKNNEETHVYTIDPTTLAWEGLTIPTSLNSGYFVVSVINGDNNGNTYYVMNADEFRAFRHALYNSINWFDAGSMADGVKKTIANPFQYLNGCFWFPMLPPVLSGTTTLKFGFWDSNVSCKVLADNAFGTYLFTIQNSGIPKHPQATTRGQYLNCNPYTRLIVYMQPWGTFEIDPSFIALGLDLHFYLRVDFVTGESLLRIEGVSGTTKKLIHTTSAMFGVPIPITQRTVDISGLAQVVGAVTTAGAGVGAGVASGLISSAISFKNPTVTQKGAQGSLASLTAPYLLNFVNYLLTEEDLTRNGRPLMQNRTPASLGGYMSVVNADMSGFIGTDIERAELKDTMRSGFYYE